MRHLFWILVVFVNVLWICVFSDIAVSQNLINPLDTIYFAPHDLGIRFSRGGQIGYDPVTGSSGMHWPKSGDQSLIFSSSFLICGKVADTLKISGNIYRDNFRSGPCKIGQPLFDPGDRKYRIYHLRSGDTSNNPDYDEWPVQFGAPANSDGTPLFYGDEQIYFIMNDLDTAAIRNNFYGDPIGLEMHCLVWTSPVPLLKDVMFIKYTYINKSSDTLRDAYIMHWADVDLGEANDDYVGSDSAHNIVYTYNGSRNDGVYGIPPALGIAVIQTPRIVSQMSDQARFGNGFVSGYRNIPVASAVWPSKSGLSNIGEPPFHSAINPVRWYNLMQGQGDSVNVLNPLTGTPSHFWFSGDPVSGTGWTMRKGIKFSNGVSYDSIYVGDMRMAISTGPFNFAPNDTQEVVVAYIPSRAANNLSPIQGLRDLSEAARASHDKYLSIFDTDVQILSSTRNQTPLKFTARGIPGENLFAQAFSYNGDTLQSIQLFNDGQHDDGNANDGLYSNTKIFPSQLNGINFSYVVTTPGKKAYRIPARLSVPLAGPVNIKGMFLIQDQNEDGKINLNEAVYLFPIIQNNSATFIKHVVLGESYIPNGPQLFNYRRYTSFFEIGADSIPVDRTIPYRENNLIKGLSPKFGSLLFQSDENMKPGDILQPKFEIANSDLNSIWFDSTTFQIDDTGRDVYDTLMIHIRGASNQKLGVRIYDPSQIKDRFYLATIRQDVTGGKRYVSLKDSLTGEVLFKDYPIDDPFSALVTGPLAIADGLKITRGTLNDIFRNDYYAEYFPKNLPNNIYFDATIEGQSVISPATYRKILIVFDSNKTQQAYRYVNGKYADRVAVPFIAYAEEENKFLRMINVGLSKNDSAHTSWITKNNEAIFFYASDYSLQPLQRYTSYTFNFGTYQFPDIDMYCMVQSFIADSTKFVFSPDTLILTPVIPASSTDAYVYRPLKGSLMHGSGSVNSFSFEPVSPNPFSTQTLIQFGISEDTHARIDVYSSLGQLVRTLLNDNLSKGKYALIWDGSWEDGYNASSGLYFIRMEAQGKSEIRKLMRMK